jgi:hypothetical protein
LRSPLYPQSGNEKTAGAHSTILGCIEGQASWISTIGTQRWYHFFSWIDWFMRSTLLHHTLLMFESRFAIFLSLRLDEETMKYFHTGMVIIEGTALCQRCSDFLEKVDNPYK